MKDGTPLVRYKSVCKLPAERVINNYERMIYVMYIESYMFFVVSCRMGGNLTPIDSVRVACLSLVVQCCVSVKVVWTSCVHIRFMTSAFVTSQKAHQHLIYFIFSHVMAMSKQRCIIVIAISSTPACVCVCARGDRAASHMQKREKKAGEESGTGCLALNRH